MRPESPYNPTMASSTWLYLNNILKKRLCYQVGPIRGNLSLSNATYKLGLLVGAVAYLLPTAYALQPDNLNTDNSSESSQHYKFHGTTDTTSAPTYDPEREKIAQVVFYSVFGSMIFLGGCVYIIYKIKNSCHPVTEENQRLLAGNRNYSTAELAIDIILAENNSQETSILTFEERIHDLKIKESSYQKFICPLTQCVMNHPVFYNGYRFEKSAITTWIRANGICPMTRKVEANKQIDFVEDLIFKNEILEFIQRKERQKIDKESALSFQARLEKINFDLEPFRKSHPEYFCIGSGKLMQYPSYLAKMDDSFKLIPSNKKTNYELSYLEKHKGKQEYSVLNKKLREEISKFVEFQEREFQSFLRRSLIPNERDLANSEHTTIEIISTQPDNHVGEDIRTFPRTGGP